MRIFLSTAVVLGSAVSMYISWMTDASADLLPEGTVYICKMRESEARAQSDGRLINRIKAPTLTTFKRDQVEHCTDIVAGKCLIFTNPRTFENGFVYGSNAEGWQLNSSESSLRMGVFQIYDLEMFATFRGNCLLAR